MTLEGQGRADCWGNTWSGSGIVFLQLADDMLTLNAQNGVNPPSAGFILNRAQLAKLFGDLVAITQRGGVLNGQQFGKLLSQLDCLHGASLSDPPCPVIIIFDTRPTGNGSDRRSAGIPPILTGSRSRRHQSPYGNRRYSAMCLLPRAADGDGWFPSVAVDCSG